jgi:DNA-binding transcriptional LysR family regulator
VNFDIANTPDIVAKVLNYEVDIGMIEGEIQHNALQLIPWQKDELVVFCSADHPLAKKKSLSSKDIKEAQWILREPDSGARHTFDKAFSGLLPELNVFLEFKHNEAIKKAVEACLGIGCLSRIVLENHFKHGDLVPLETPKRDLKRTFYFVLPKQPFENEAVKTWIELCKTLDIS